MGMFQRRRRNDDDTAMDLGEWLSELTALNLTGTSSLGPITITRNAGETSTGKIEEQADSTTGTLDVGPLGSGNASSSYDVFFTVDVDGGSTVLTNPTSLSLSSGPFSTLRIAPGNRLAGATPVALNDVSDNPSGFSLGFSSVVLIPSDFGDAPDLGAGIGAGDYETLLENAGPSHILVDDSPRLGAEVDGELDATVSAAADADDTIGDPDDEDGVVISDFYVAGESGQVEITVSQAGGYVVGWMDFNQNGDFTDPDEEIVFGMLAADETRTFDFQIPADATAGDTYARFRVFDMATGPSGPTGEVIGGEVEDYAVQIKGLDYGDAPSSLAFDRFVDPNPSPGNDFGSQVVPLATGNVVITAPFDDAAAENAGAVYLFNGQTGELISTLTGSTAGDQVGNFGVTPLEGGNYVVRSVLLE